MKLFGLADIVELRMLNFVILGLGVYIAIKQNIKVNKETDYLQNLGAGFIASVVAVGMFCFSSVFYLKFIDPEFIFILEKSGFWGGGELFPIQVAVAVFIEGMSSGLVMSFVMMQYFKGVLVVPKKRKPVHH